MKGRTNTHSGLSVMMACSPAYVAPTAVALRSLQQSGTSIAVIRVVTSGLSEHDTAVLQQALSEFPAGYLVDATELEEFPQISYLGAHGHVSTARLFPRIGSFEGGGRVLFLDSDTLVIDSLDGLVELDMHEFPVAACRDHVFPWFGAPPRDNLMDWPPADVPAQAPYFNAGILLYDLANWDEGGYQNEIKRILREQDFEIVDPDCLNVALLGKIRQLPGRYNASHAVLSGQSLDWAGFVEEERHERDPAILHFIGWPKPWSPLASPSDPYVNLWRSLAAELGIRSTWSRFSVKGAAFRASQRLKPALLRLLQER